MDLTQGANRHKEGRAKKMMLWFGIVSMVMMFGGLTSAYVVSKNRPDWLSSLGMPDTLYWSTIVIFLSSISLIAAERAVKRNNRPVATAGLLGTLGLSFLFIYFQFETFSQFISSGYYFTGATSSITTSFLFLIVGSHLVHLLAGIIVLFVLIYNHFKQRYYAGHTLGLELGAIYWHFVDVLWIYLFLFLYFVR